MYITINNVIGEKTINLAYPIINNDSSKEIGIVDFFQDNVTIEFKADYEVKLGNKAGAGTKTIPSKTYIDRELKAYMSGDIDLAPLFNEKNRNIVKINRLANIMEMNFFLDQLDNTKNFIDGYPSYLLLPFYVTSFSFTQFNSMYPQYKKLRSGICNSLTISIKDQNSNLITNGLGTNVVLHVR